jgi:hypothetical protein
LNGCKLLVLLVCALVGKLGKLRILCHYVHVSTLAVWHHTVGAILDGCAVGLLDVGKVATALIGQSVQWAVAKQAVEVFRIVGFVTGKIFAVAILEKCKVVFSHDTPRND